MFLLISEWTLFECVLFLNWRSGAPKLILPCVAPNCVTGWSEEKNRVSEMSTITVPQYLNLQEDCYALHQAFKGMLTIAHFYCLILVLNPPSSDTIPISRDFEMKCFRSSWWNIKLLLRV
jgi:hypothetical protein